VALGVVPDVSEGRRLFSWAFARFCPFADRAGLAQRRRRLLASARGRIVEIGAGTGANLLHYPDAVDELIVTEPDPHMLKRLRRAISGANVPVRLEQAPASRLPLADRSVDAVVSTLVLCSVPEQDAALREAFRVLRPGGRLLFLEHVRAQDPRAAARQDRWTPLHRRIAGGCHPNRDSLAAITAAGFEVRELERYEERGPRSVRPHISGSASRPDGTEPVDSNA
jgi:ubiquinone/menaquinone biosynthesis C-methylase UbiE